MDEALTCGQCDGPLIDNPWTDSTLPFYCPSCDVIYDWEDFDYASTPHPSAYYDANN